MSRTFTDSDPNATTKHLENFDYMQLGENYNHDEHIAHLKYLTTEYHYSKRYFVKLLLRAIEENNTTVSDVLFEYFKVPDNLTLKEKITYLQLLGE